MGHGHVTARVILNTKEKEKAIETGWFAKCNRYCKRRQCIVKKSGGKGSNILLINP